MRSPVPAIRHDCDAAGRHELHGTYWIAGPAGQAIAYLQYGRVTPGVVSDRAYVGLSWVYTDPLHQGRGFAFALLDRLYRDNRDAEIVRGLATDDGADWLARYDARPLAEAVEIIQTEEDTGGTRRPLRLRLAADHARLGEVGRLICYPPRRRTGRALIGELYVPPEYQRQGVASRLMDAFRDAHRGVIVDRRDATPGGRAWWERYAAARGDQPYSRARVTQRGSGRPPFTPGRPARQEREAPQMEL